MNDARIIEELEIHGITIAGAIGDTANKARITVEFSQSVRTPYEFNEADHKRALGKLVGTHGAYFGQMKHRFCVEAVQDAWPEIQRRARAYQELEKSLQKIL